MRQPEDGEDREVWEEIWEFPDYLVSTHGRVLNHHTDRVKVSSLNQQGIPNVNLVQNGLQNRRSVSLLVANAFLPRDPRPDFDTPINLDGDRQNNHISNLAWRPRWFAQRYHTQYKRPIPWGARNFEIRLVSAVANKDLYPIGEIIPFRDAAMKYGLLERDLMMGCHNKIPVFPDWVTFEIVFHS